MIPTVTSGEACPTAGPAEARCSGQQIPGKWEGLTIGPRLLDGSFVIVVSTDNDYSVTQNASNTQFDMYKPADPPAQTSNASAAERDPVKRAMSEALNRYIESGHRKVDGWLSAMAIRSTVTLGKLQKRLGIRGAASEIGVHHGRLFILLHLLTEPPEISVAWDLFEFQNENADGSGHGDKHRFQTNLVRHGCDLNRIKINTVNSRTLTADNIIAECESKVRIFSVDARTARQALSAIFTWPSLAYAKAV